MQSRILGAVALFLWAMGSSAQLASPIGVPTSIDAKPVLDAAGPLQRASISNVYLVACPKGQGAVLGTGFLIDSGVLVTNAHVTDVCGEQTLTAIGADNKPFKFSKVLKDQNRDLAILVPEVGMTGGFRLAASDSIPPGTEVSTWGYPFAYNGVSPLLSVGYVSGYREVSAPSTVKHIVVNGAFNHGNSGGPLLVSQHNEVIGIVVMTFHFYPPAIENLIQALSASRSGLMYTTSEKNPDGTNKTVSEAQITGVVLQEFYEKTQTMIGEAIAVSELKAFLREKSADLPIKRPKK